MKTRALGIVFLTLCSQGALAAPTTEVLKARAEAYQAAGLSDLAREQFLFIQKNDPADKSVPVALNKLSQEMTEAHLKNALNARKHRALKLALYETERALKINPSDKKIKTMHRELAKECARKAALQERVSKDYLAGVTHFEAQRYDRALESFVKVLNMAPHHTGAERYVQRIGERMGVVR